MKGLVGDSLAALGLFTPGSPTVGHPQWVTHPTSFLLSPNTLSCELYIHMNVRFGIHTSLSCHSTTHLGTRVQFVRYTWMGPSLPSPPLTLNLNRRPQVSVTRFRFNFALQPFN